MKDLVGHRRYQVMAESELLDQWTKLPAEQRLRIARRMERLALMLRLSVVAEGVIGEVLAAAEPPDGVKSHRPGRIG